MAVEVNSSQECLELFIGGRLGEICNSGNLFQKRGHTTGTDLQAEKFHLRPKKLAFGPVPDQTLVTEVLQHYPQVACVQAPVRTGPKMLSSR